MSRRRDIAGPRTGILGATDRSLRPYSRFNTTTRWNADHPWGLYLITVDVYSGAIDRTRTGRRNGGSA
jgi:hypothetical protein